MHIGTAHVQFNDLHTRGSVDPAAALAILIERETTDIGYDRTVERTAHHRKFLLQDSIYAWVLKTYRIEHSRSTFGHSRERIAEAGMQSGPLERDGPEDIKVIESAHHVTVAETTACRNNRIFKTDSAKVYLKTGIRQIHIFAGAAVAVSHFHISSSFLKAGPSIQILLLPPTVSTEQHTQAPKPQPMRASRLTSPGISRPRQTARNIGVGPHA